MKCKLALKKKATKPKIQYKTSSNLHIFNIVLLFYEFYFYFEFFLYKSVKYKTNAISLSNERHDDGMHVLFCSLGYIYCKCK